MPKGTVKTSEATFMNDTMLKNIDLGMRSLVNTIWLMSSNFPRTASWKTTTSVG